MNRIATFLLLSALCAPSVMMVGCGQTADQRAGRAEERIGRGDLDGGRSDLASALAKGQKENMSAEEQQRLRSRIVQVDEMIRVRGITREDDARANAASHLQNAKRHADARAWREMIREVSAAESEAKKAHDPALDSEIRRFYTTRPMMLMRAQKVYREVCSSVNWAIGTDFFDVPGSEWWAFGSYLDAGDKLEKMCQPIGDSALTTAAHELTSNWRSCLNFKNAADALEDSKSTLGQIAYVAARAKQVKDAIDYDRARGKFERRMRELLGAATMDAVQYAPQRRDRPQPAPAAPVASAPEAGPIPAGVPVTPSNTSRAEAPAPAASAAPVTAPSVAPAGPVARTDVDRTRPNFDDVN